MFNDLVTSIIPRRFHLYGVEERLAQENYDRVIPEGLHVRFQTLLDEQISIFCADGNTHVGQQSTDYSIQRTDPPPSLFNGSPRYQFDDIRSDERIIVWSFGLCYRCRQPVKLVVSRSRSGIAMVEEHSCQRYFLSHDLMSGSIPSLQGHLVQTRSLVLQLCRWCLRYESSKKPETDLHGQSSSAVASQLSKHWADLIDDFYYAVPNG